MGEGRVRVAEFEGPVSEIDLGGQSGCPTRARSRGDSIRLEVPPERP